MMVADVQKNAAHAYVDGGHYNHPPCQSDEAQASVQGAGGVLCAPSCTAHACPSDVPPGTTAEPQCVLKDASGQEYCALVCAGGETCPEEAVCSPLGICVYPSKDITVPEFMMVADAQKKAAHADVDVGHYNHPPCQS